MQLQPIVKAVCLVPISIHVRSLGGVIAHCCNLSYINFDSVFSIRVVNPGSIWTLTQQ